MRQAHKGGERVGVLGASNLTYAEATRTQQCVDFIQSHVRFFEYIGGRSA